MLSTELEEASRDSFVVQDLDVDTLRLMLDYLYLGKGRCHLRFSGFCPLRGGEGVPPFSAKEKNLLFFTLIFR